MLSYEMVIDIMEKHRNILSGGGRQQIESTLNLLKMSHPINLKNIDRNQLQLWLDNFDVILTDCDGVLWHDNEIISQVPETVNHLQTMGKQVYFVTNNGTKTRHDLWLKATAMNFHIDETHIIAPTYFIADYLKLHLKVNEKVYVIGSTAIGQEFDQLNIPYFGLGKDIVPEQFTSIIAETNEINRNENVAAVVVGFDEHFSFAKMLKACSFLVSRNECFFLATNADAVHKYPRFCIPGTGAILKALETCTGREAMVMGKPNPIICKDLITESVINPKRTLMVGDCVKTDVVFGKNCGFHTLLVGSGRYQWPEVEDLVKRNEIQYIPDYFLPSLGDLKALF